MRSTFCAPLHHLLKARLVRTLELIHLERHEERVDSLVSGVYSGGGLGRRLLLHRAAAEAWLPGSALVSAAFQLNSALTVSNTTVLRLRISWHTYY